MEKNEVLMFRDFHLIVQPYKTSTQYEFYNELFKWAYPDGGVPVEYISRWCSGRKPVSELISGPAAVRPEEELARYSGTWEQLLKNEYIHGSKTLMTSLRDAIRKDVFQQRKRLPKAEHEMLAWALVQALRNGYIKQKVQIDPSLLSTFREADKRCRAANIPLNTPYILNILLGTPHSPLLQALNRLEPGLGERYANSTKEYAATTSHGGRYEGWDVTESEFLFYAQATAFSENRETAGELDIVKGLLRSRSTVVKSLLQYVGGREVLTAVLLALNKTTVPGILF